MKKQIDLSPPAAAALTVQEGAVKTEGEEEEEEEGEAADEDQTEEDESEKTGESDGRLKNVFNLSPLEKKGLGPGLMFTLFPNPLTCWSR